MWTWTTNPSSKRTSRRTQKRRCKRRKQLRATTRPGRKTVRVAPRHAAEAPSPGGSRSSWADWQEGLLQVDPLCL
eukprot:12902700-Prorocentrum_lima.AAC.1